MRGVTVIHAAGVIANRRRRCGNLNVLRKIYPIPIGHAGTQFYEIPTVASLPRNDRFGGAARFKLQLIAPRKKRPLLSQRSSLLTQYRYRAE